MELHIVVKGKIPEKLKKFLEGLRTLIEELLVADGMEPGNITSALIWKDEVEDVQK